VPYSERLTEYLPDIAYTTKDCKLKGCCISGLLIYSDTYFIITVVVVSAATSVIYYVNGVTTDLPPKKTAMRGPWV